MHMGHDIAEVLVVQAPGLEDCADSRRDLHDVFPQIAIGLGSKPVEMLVVIEGEERAPAFEELVLVQQHDGLAERADGERVLTGAASGDAGAGGTVVYVCHEVL